MGYRGQSFFIPFDKGGLNHNKNMDMIPPEAMVHPSRNVNLNQNGRQTRGGTSYVYSSAISGTPQIMGIYDFTRIGGTQYIVVVGKDGKVYRNSTTAIKTGWTTSEKYACFAVFDNELYIVNGYNTPAKWDGSTWTDLTDIPADWTGVNMPQWIINHGRGASQRMFAGGCPTNPGRIYISPTGDGDDFSDANVTQMDIDTGDAYGIVGAVEFGDRLFLLGRRQSYLMDDTDADIANWGWQKAQWEGGTANFRLICRLPNDIVSMMDDGEVYSATALDNYGDYKAASIARPAYINEWIAEYLDLSKINQFHMQYDPILRCIKIFGVKKGYSVVNLALCYFIDRGPLDGWIPHDNDSANSGYDASASALVKVSEGEYKIYTGDYDGMVWSLESSSANDNGNAFYNGFKTPKLSMQDVRTNKKFAKGWLSFITTGAWPLYINWWVDNVLQETRGITASTEGGTLDIFVLDTDALGGDEVTESWFFLGNVGKRIQFEIFMNGVSEEFFISVMAVDYKYLGKVNQRRDVAPGVSSSPIG